MLEGISQHDLSERNEDSTCPTQRANTAVRKSREVPSLVGSSGVGMKEEEMAGWLGGQVSGVTIKKSLT
jgi:hypothetical protein